MQLVPQRDTVFEPYVCVTIIYVIFSLAVGNIQNPVGRLVMKIIILKQLPDRKELERKEEAVA